MSTYGAVKASFECPLCCRIRTVRFGWNVVACGLLAKRAKRTQRLEKSTSAPTEQIGSQRLYILASFLPLSQFLRPSSSKPQSGRRLPCRNGRFWLFVRDQQVQARVRFLPFQGH